MIHISDSDVYDVTIIGGGPAGLFSAFYSGLREMKTKIIEYHPFLGGKVNVYPEKIVWDIGAMPPLPGQQVVENMVEQGLTFDPKVVLNEEVVCIDKNETGLFIVKAASGNIHYSKTIIVAVGGGILNPKRLPLPNAIDFEETNLHYSVKNLKQFKNKRVLISGGGNSATDWAKELSGIAKEVYIACRSDFSCHESQITYLKNNSVVCFTQTQITELVANDAGDCIEKVAITNRESGVVQYIPIDDVIVNHGYDRDKSLLENSPLDIQISDNYFISGSSSSESSIPGLFAAGDILHHDGKLHLIAGAFQDAANAVNQAKLYLEPEATKTAMVSSHNEKLYKRNEKIVADLLNE
ncbi:ferredoxin--NADP reductase 1 [Virgibacillus pantothenticus]|uniref:Ferredoxin--NADP reductase n=1 Tax=Virgibacillus pantothenticus TaxID=1473 RepID=A0A0L0QVB9_VIRPA|nr:MULTISPECIES: NAD(P)/FAD-dependent oxidoreductase [Virgibacillus]API92424.1 thioredoxin reductase [Virgibacillus sp. 6R]KNE22625.1 thioredoxin reductase [Virgibacillus pantothenticus]MBS7427329.1 NAD(P)/FAD-dependent oxidoreductase [Virgibacillus sp. 19R1-5]MBU8567020.1 NAD(P)/FAD-dependent oxidoreductase [Virgibacillus pantothenticus]MBU8601944.1 NAD(P)/FAD-dependent oxidoreductase [Virgibacillus pantothenticus]